MFQLESSGLWWLGIVVLCGVLALSGCNGGSDEEGDLGGQAAPEQVTPLFIQSQSLRFKNGSPFGIQFGAQRGAQPTATLLVGDFGGTNAAPFTLVSNGFMASGTVSRLGTNDPYVLNVQRSTFPAASGPQENTCLEVKLLDLPDKPIVRAQSSRGSANHEPHLQCNHLSLEALAKIKPQDLPDRSCLVVSSILVGPKDEFTIPLSVFNAGRHSEQITQFVLTHAPRILNLQEATKLKLDASTTGVLGEEGGDVDAFRIALSTTGLLTVRTIGITDTFGTLLDGNGQILAENDDISRTEPAEGDPDLNFGISLMLQAGEYFVEVRGFEAVTTGAYAIVTSFTREEDMGVTSRVASSSALSQVIPAPWRRKAVMRRAPSAYFASSSQRQPKAVPLAHQLSASQASGGDFAPAQFDEVIQIDPNSSTPGTLAEFGEVDAFQIDLPIAGLLTLHTTGSTDTVGELRDAQGQLLASNDDDLDQNFAIGQLLPAGTYFVTVSGFDGFTIGDYTLEASFIESTPVELDTPARGMLTEPGELDFFHIDLPTAGLLTVRTTGNTDTVGDLYDAQSRLLAFNDDGGDGFNSAIVMPVSAGVHFVIVSGFDSTTGDYTLRVSLADDESDPALTLGAALTLTVMAPAVMASGTPERLSECVSGFSSQSCNAVIVDQPPALPSKLNIEVGSAEGAGDYVLEIFSSPIGTADQDTCAGNRVVEKRDASASPPGQEVEQVVKAGGCMRIAGDSGDEDKMVAPFDDDVYTFSIADVAPSVTFLLTTTDPEPGFDDSVVNFAPAQFDEAIQIDPNSSTPGTLAEVGEVDRFRIDLTAAGLLMVRTTGNTDTMGELFDAQGLPIAFNDNASDFELNFMISRSLPAGTYFVTVSGFVFTLSDYTLEVSFQKLGSFVPFDLVIFTVDDEDNDNFLGSFLGECRSNVGASDATNQTTCSFLLGAAQSRKFRALVFDRFDIASGYTLDILPAVLQEVQTLPEEPRSPVSGCKVCSR